MKTVVGQYSSVAEANKVKAALQDEGYDMGDIKVVDQSTDGFKGSTESQPLTEKIKGFFSGFTDHHNEEDHQQYASRISNGGALLAVTVPDDEAEEAAMMLQDHGATGIENSKSRSSEPQRTADSGDQVLSVVQEDLVVGKREVDRGGVRIYSHLVERPVTADVTLHDERVVVERRPVDRAATEADFSTGRDVVELTAMGEEAVVGKTSRVVEEVRLGKQASEHTEQIHDTVRHTEIDVEQLPVSVNEAKQ